jgi:hypothetical protein
MKQVMSTVGMKGGRTAFRYARHCAQNILDFIGQLMRNIESDL